MSGIDPLLATYNDIRQQIQLRHPSAMTAR